MRAIAVHGGAGRIAPPAEEAARRAACEQALALGWRVLADGGSALDAVTRAVVALEDAPVLNAGTGACLTATGAVELDASIMEGGTRRAGAVAVLRRIANPVLLARSLLEQGPHVLMMGAAAEELAAARGVPLVDPARLITPARRAAWEACRAGRTAAPAPTGTVGAVAVDDAGCTAAATSTGGIDGKQPGRVGDSAVIGAGTLADDRAGAVSATGDGETIMRATLAGVAVAALRAGLDPAAAAMRALAELRGLPGGAGLILVDRFGRVAGAHTTPHMTWCARDLLRAQP